MLAFSYQLMFVEQLQSHHY